MSDWIKNRKISVIFLVLGGIGGFLYWRLIGCTSGTCPITSNWYATTLYGMLLGWLTGDLISSFKKKKPEA